MTANNENDNFADDLLVKYLLKETDTEENARAEQWINASPHRQKYFEQLRQVWQKSRILNTDSPSENAAWERFQQRVQDKGKKSRGMSMSLKRVLSAAAILLVVFSGTWIWRQYISPMRNLLAISSGTNTLTDTLTDNTIVTLNKDSRLSYSTKFAKKNRMVRLQGEAFFNVAARKDQPFIIHVNDITITVLGTSFNVNGTHHATEIIVKSGTVKVTGGKNSIQLHADEKVTISNKQDLLKKERSDNQLYNYYRTHEFICNRTPLKELIAVLNEAYDAHIVTDNPQIGRLLITSTFHRNQPLDSILNIITQTFGQVTYTRQGNQIILK